MIKMSYTDLLAKLKELEEKIKIESDTKELAKLIAVYEFIRNDLIGE